jgi:hypothetical protein
MDNPAGKGVGDSGHHGLDGGVISLGTAFTQAKSLTLRTGAGFLRGSGQKR